MTITSTVAIDLVDRDRYPLAQVYAKQDDSLSRAIAASIYAAGVAWVPPSGATAVIRYRRPDGIGGIYDELPDGSVAYTISDNVITAYIAPDALSCPGRVRMDIVIVNGTEALATFDISVLVDAAPTSGVAPTNGYYKYKTLADINAALAARVQSVNDQTPDNKGNVQINAEQTGAVSQTAFDAAMTTVVRKVNGVTPDTDGNVNVSGGSGGNVLSVNGKTGAVQIPVPASGVCSVGAEIPTKVVESVSPGASPVEGALVYVKFEAANTAENPTLTFMGYTAHIVDGDGNDVSPGALTAGTHGFQRRGEAWVLLDGSGAAGEDGGYYAPSVDSGGNLTWTASKAGMPQVSGANIKGPKGDTGQQGPAGADGTPITWQGEWVASNVYAKNDAVSYDGSAWVMTAGPVVGAVPGVDSRWALMARKGADGGNGVGIASIARTSGTGAAGTTDTYTITMTNGSTSTFTVYNGKDGASGSGSSAVTSVNGKTGNVELPVSGFGTCATAASTAIKVVDGLPEDFLVQDGAQLCVKFSNANTAAMPKLSVAGASATIFDARTSYNVDAAGIGARTHHFVYFSGIWVLLDALQIPVPTSDDHGKFLRVSGRAYVLEALDVSEAQSDFELIDSIDWSTEDMAQAGAAKEYTLNGVTEIIIVWQGMANETQTTSFLDVRLNDLSFSGCGIVPTSKAGSALYGFSFYRCFEGVGTLVIRSPGANAVNRVATSAQIPYSLFDVTERISKLKISNSYNYVANTGITKIYVR